ncbi:MAG: hypothetical protein WBF93_12420 [Pirellulales bacterium]|nr:hypothetical protein [Pirellulales bacterium]
MKRRRLPDAERISLFPFLAVLICTMGALLVLLVVIAQRVQAGARASQKADTAEFIRTHRQQQAKFNELRTHVQELQNTHSKVASGLAQRRDALSHVEDHMRRLRDEFAALQRAVQQLNDTSNDDFGRLAQIRQEIDRLTAQIAESEKLLAETLDKKATRQASYAIIPYEGANGTRRRPIYLDCQASTIILQPEGIELSEQDFRQPLGPDNPLAAVLRATVEYHNDGHTSDEGRPYPLLLVRPTGIRAYYAARAALKSWDTDFGYELIGDDWTVEHSAPDPQLARIVQQELVFARQRHEALVMQERGSGSGGRGIRGGQSRIPSAGPGAPGFGRLPAGSQEESQRDSEGGPNAWTSPNETNRDGGSADQPHASDPPNAAGGTSGGGPGTDDDQPPGARPSKQQQSPSDPSQAAGQTSTSSAGDTVPRADQSAAAGVTITTDAKSLADAKGSDWALPGASRSAVPFTRPMRIEVYPDRLVIVPRDQSDEPKTIRVSGATQEAIEEFVSAVWDHMGNWGIAGRGMYWKPILNVYVAPGGQQRAADMEALLDDSGLEVQRR